MDKDWAITIMIMLLSSMPAAANDHRASITSTPASPTVIRHASKLRYPNRQRIHDQQGCGNFVLYG